MRRCRDGALADVRQATERWLSQRLWLSRRSLATLSRNSRGACEISLERAAHRYYETICSGSPAGPGFAGTDAVQTHMTNTRLTDPEVLELRYPVVLEDFHVRAGSGGRGRWNAGDGILRAIRFLEPMECTILSGHRRVRPFGLAGGESGELGENAVRRADGRIEKLQGCDATTIEAGGTIIIKTPTGGGYGEPAK
jgi:5-oxoprolinase (ATP-hydrolysing)